MLEQILYSVLGWVIGGSLWLILKRHNIPCKIFGHSKIHLLDGNYCTGCGKSDVS